MKLIRISKYITKRKYLYILYQYVLYISTIWFLNVFIYDISYIIIFDYRLNLMTLCIFRFLDLYFFDNFKYLLFHHIILVSLIFISIYYQTSVNTNYFIFFAISNEYIIIYPYFNNKRLYRNSKYYLAKITNVSLFTITIFYYAHDYYYIKYSILSFILCVIYSYFNKMIKYM